MQENNIVSVESLKYFRLKDKSKRDSRPAAKDRHLKNT